MSKNAKKNILLTFIAILIVMWIIQSLSGVLLSQNPFVTMTEAAVKKPFDVSINVREKNDTTVIVDISWDSGLYTAYDIELTAKSILGHVVTLSGTVYENRFSQEIKVKEGIPYKYTIKLRTVMLVVKSKCVKKSISYTMSGKASLKIKSIIDERGVLGMNDFEKILFAHDYLVKHIDYDDNYVGKGIHEAIFEKKAVCQGYSEAFYVFMEKLNIPVRYVIASNNSHVWNMVKLDGEWYHVDVTWDDPCGMEDFTYKHPTYSFFLQSTSQLSKKGQYYDHKYKKKSYPLCTSKIYNNLGATKDYTEAIPETNNRYYSNLTFHPWKNEKPIVN